MIKREREREEGKERERFLYCIQLLPRNRLMRAEGCFRVEGEREML